MRLAAIVGVVTVPVAQILSHQDLADAIGATRETVTQVLTELRGQQMIGVGRKQIKVLNLSGLIKLASG